MNTLTQLQRDVLYGSLLGDGHLEGYTHRSYRYILVQSTRKPVYMSWIQKVFQDYSTSHALSLGSYHTTQGVGSTYRFVTRRHPVFQPAAHLFYRSEGKRVPRCAHMWLTPRALAVWYMEDGGMKSRQKVCIFIPKDFPMQMWNI